MLQLTELVTPWSFCLAIHQISSHRCCGLPIDPTEIPLTVRCGVCSSNASTIAGFATSTTWNSLIEEWRCFDQNIIDRAVWQWRVRLRTCVCASGGYFDVFVYELLRRLFHIGNFCFWVTFLKQLLLRNYAVDFVEICNVYAGKMIIKAVKRIFNSDKICRSYSDLNFGVTFFGTQVYTLNHKKRDILFLTITLANLRRFL